MATCRSGRETVTFRDYAEGGRLGRSIVWIQFLASLVISKTVATYKWNKRKTSVESFSHQPNGDVNTIGTDVPTNASRGRSFQRVCSIVCRQDADHTIVHTQCQPHIGGTLVEGDQGTTPLMLVPAQVRSAPLMVQL